MGKVEVSLRVNGDPVCEDNGIELCTFHDACPEDVCFREASWWDTPQSEGVAEQRSVPSHRAACLKWLQDSLSEIDNYCGG